MAILDELFGIPQGVDPSQIQQFVAKLAQLRNGGVTVSDPSRLEQTAPPLPPVREISPAPGQGAPYTAVPESQVSAQPPQKTAATGQIQASNAAAATPGFGERMIQFGRALQGAEPTNLDKSYETENLTVSALKQRGFDDNTAKVIARNPTALQKVLVGLAGLANKYGKAGTILQGSDGRFYSVQFGEDGTRKVEPFDVGLEPAKGVKTVDEGTGTRVISGATGQDVRTVPKDVAGRETQEEMGKAKGKAIADLPRVIGNAESLVKSIDTILADPNLSNVTGLEAYLPTIRSSSHDLEARINQVKGGAFLNAYETLRGGGAITEKEGEKATQAKARLDNLKQSDAGYRQALMDFRNEVAKLVDIAKARAAGTMPMPSDGPSVGTSGAPGAPRIRTYNPATGRLE